MALIASQQILETGKTATLSSASASDTFTNSGKEFLFVKNENGSSINVTVTVEVSSVDISSFGTLTKSNTVFAVANGAEAFLGTFPPGAYNGDNAIVTFACSATENVKVAILYL